VEKLHLRTAFFMNHLLTHEKDKPQQTTVLQLIDEKGKPQQTTVLQLIDNEVTSKIQ